MIIFSELFTKNKFKGGGCEMVKEKTTIAVSKEVYEKLVSLGRKNESFDAILRRLLGVKREK